MRRSPYFHLMCLLAIVSHITACIHGPRLPERIYTTEEVYPPETFSGANLLPQKKGKIEKSFEASYDTVFRALRLSLSKYKYYTDSVMEKKGIILASKMVSINDTVSIDGARIAVSKMMYFLGAKLKKVGPERTQLALYQKMQGECSSSGYGTAVIGTIFSLGLLGPTIFDGVAEEQKACKELSTLHPDEKDLKGIMRSVDGILLEGGDI